MKIQDSTFQIPSQYLKIWAVHLLHRNQGATTTLMKMTQWFGLEN